MTDKLLSDNAVVPKRADAVCFMHMSCVEDQCKEFQDNIQFIPLFEMLSQSVINNLWNIIDWSVEDETRQKRKQL